MDFTLGEIAAASGGRLVLRGEINHDTCVSLVVIDSRQVMENGVFLATVGERVDGHKFIASVFEKGAVLAITQKTPEQVEAETGISSEKWGSYLLVEDTLQALKDIAEAYRRKLSIPIVGITGSVGKTSTKEFIAGVLAEKFHVLKTDGNYNNEIGVPLTLLRIREEHTAAVVEMGISDFGEMHRLSKMVRPDICVITNIGQCHLENLKTRDGILKAKSEIFDFMTEDGQVCLYGGDDKLATLTEIKGRKPHFFGWGDNPLEEVTVGNVVSHGLWGSDALLTIKRRGSGRLDHVSDPVKATGATPVGARTADAMPVEVQETGAMPVGARTEDAMPVEAQAADAASAETRATSVMSEEAQIPIHVPLPGRHMVLNSAAAACVAGLLGLSPEQIQSGIRKIRPVNGRNNLIRLKEYTLIDDCYNANPASMKAAIDLLAMADTKKVAILGDMFELGENSHTLHEETGAYAASAGIDRIYCVGQEAEYMYRAACERIAAAEGVHGQMGVEGVNRKAEDTHRQMGAESANRQAEDAHGQMGAESVNRQAEDTHRQMGAESANRQAEDAHGQIGAEGTDMQIERADRQAEGSSEPANCMGMAPAQVMHFPTKQDLLLTWKANLAQYIPKGSTILIKASHGMEFTEIVEMFKGLENNK